MAKKRAVSKQKRKSSRAKAPTRRKRAAPWVKPEGPEVARLQVILSEMMDHVIQMKQIQKARQKKLSTIKKELSSTKNPEEKFQHAIDIETTKVGFFPEVEPRVRSMIPLMNEGYALSLQLGGRIKSFYLDMCKDLNKGFNLKNLEQSLKKIHKLLA